MFKNRITYLTLLIPALGLCSNHGVLAQQITVTPSSPIAGQIATLSVPACGGAHESLTSATFFEETSSVDAIEQVQQYLDSSYTAGNIHESNGYYTTTWFPTTGTWYIAAAVNTDPFCKTSWGPITVVVQPPPS